MENRQDKQKFTHSWMIVGVLIIAAFFAGVIFTSVSRHEKGSGSASSQIWYCSMDPQIRSNGPGKCSICGMDLIPMPAGLDTYEDINQLVVSEAAAKLMEIQTQPVERKFVNSEIRLVGKIDYDETKLKDITAWVPGRIDRLYIDFTGIEVKKGDHMVYLYSPQLISAQAELLQASKAAQSATQGSDLVRRSTLATLEASREKLRLLGLSREQITNIETSGEPETHITINSPIGGVVIEKKATEGMYVQTGTLIYTVADLSTLWVKLDAYESDMSWIRYGQQVTFTTEAYPGEYFNGIISFIDPVLNDKTRTVKLRVNINNSDGKLKPEMFVRAIVKSDVAAGGKVMTPSMAGLWTCPMHPDILSPKAGKCPICSMDLVTTESLGYTEVTAPNEPPLVIPATAPLITGTRAVVYVRILDTEKPTFEAREVTLGPRAGDYYIVKSGLKEGDIVVTNGNFKIDSEMQIKGKPSMMNPMPMQPIPADHNHKH